MASTLVAMASNLIAFSMLLCDVFFQNGESSNALLLVFLGLGVCLAGLVWLRLVRDH